MLTVTAYHGARVPFDLADINLDPWFQTTDERKVSLGAYFTTNQLLASMYGQVLVADLCFHNLVDLRMLNGVFTALDFYASLPVDIPERLAGEVSAGYIGALEPHHLLEFALTRIDIVREMKTMGYDGIAFREANSDVFVPFARSVIHPQSLMKRKTRWRN